MLFEDWCKENKLEINNDKTKLIRLTQDVRLNFIKVARKGIHSL